MSQYGNEFIPLNFETNAKIP